MPLPTAPAPQTRAHQRSRITPASAGLPDPRPLTGYTAEYQELDGHSRVNITLDSPCIIREPAWVLIDVADGSALPPDAMKALSPTEFFLDFVKIIPGTVCLVQVPYQDMQVQNYFGGFVSPGAKWFRAPTT
ncbi:MAG TPA: hypothetical protein VHC70_13645 [Phycisphaerales bacterium]|nr:hypothetical protein [Phycisphaerales bacterium]